jgi:hypothetical protein
MLHLLQWLYTYVVSYCSQCFICFHTYVASVCIYMLHMFHTYVTSVLSRYCVCFTMVLRRFSGVFASVSDACFKCFICLQIMYVASVASGCFKSRSGVASPFSLSTVSPQCLLLLLLVLAGHPLPPSPSFSMLVTFGRHDPRVGARNDARNKMHARASGCSVCPDVRALTSL